MRAAVYFKHGKPEDVLQAVEVDDPVTGTVRLKSRVNEADEMALDTRSTKTVRAARGG